MHNVFIPDDIYEQLREYSHINRMTKQAVTIEAFHTFFELKEFKYVQPDQNIQK